MLLVVLFISTSALGQSSSTPLITEMQVSNGDSTYRYLYLYNNNAQKSLETKYVMVNTEWSRREQTEWIYSNNLCTNQYTRKWLNSAWDLTHQIDFAYNNNLPITETHFVYEGGTYNPTKKHIYNYTNNKLVNEIDSNWINSNWIISSMTDYKYNATSKNLDTLYFTKFNNGVQSLKSKINFAYNDSMLVTKQTFSEKQDTNWVNVFQTASFYKPFSTKKSYETKKTWNTNTKKWEYSENITYDYSPNGNLKSETYQRWDSQFWNNVIRYEYSFNAENAIIKKTSFMPIYDDFRAASSINYSEFENGKASLIEAKNEFWGGETGSLINTFVPFQFNNESAIKYGSRIKISYIPVNDTGVTTLDNATKNGLIDIYPNPSDGIFYFDSHKYDVESWIVSDISGKTIVSKHIQEKSGVIDITELKSGIYLLRVKTALGTLSQKLIKK